MKTKIVCLVLVTLALFVSYPDVVYADDCSSSADCANVVQGSSCLSALLALILGAILVARSTSKQAKSYNVKKGRRFPKEIKWTPEGGTEKTVKVKFRDSKDGVSSDNEVRPELVEAVEFTVIDAIDRGAQIDSITISATTNGEHSENSRHYVQRGGKAVDISAVNDQSVTSIGDSDPVSTLQDSFNTQPGRAT